MKKTLIFSLLSLIGLNSSALTDAEIERNIADLLSKMTLQEKIGQLNQRTGLGLDPGMTSQIRSGAVGSILNEVDPETVNALQREAVENSRLHIPLIFCRDVIHGFKTIFPLPIGQAATWNPALVEEGSRIAADEATSVGVRLTFSPMVDVARDPRWGRIAEGYGEDTYLTSVMGVAAVKGYQGKDLAEPDAMAACTKHFAGYAAAEAGLDYNTTWVPETQLRETYLPPFKACADAGSATFMCSFNDINGVPSSGNVHLLRDILRNEWGYKGTMISDWGAIGMMLPHAFAPDLREATKKAVKAGVDIDMESYAYTRHLEDLVKSGEIAEAEVDSLTANVLRLKYRLGLFDNPYVDISKSRRFYAPASLDAARRAAEESAILMKNNGVLPIDGKKVKKIAVIGPMADAQHDQAGTWVFDLEKEHCITPLTALREKFGEKNVTYVRAMKNTRDRSDAGFAEAVKAARKADLVLFFGGEEAVLSGEAHCRTNLELPGAQNALLSALKATGKPVVLIVQAGRSLAIVPQVEEADATVFAFHGGTMFGPAITNLLSGDVNFSGRSPLSFPRMSGQTPIYYCHKPTGRPVADMTLIDDIPDEAEQTSTGCSSYYLDAGNGPAFPFGYGLSYTTFEYSTPKLSATEITPGGNITVKCTVTNTGAREGKEVAQLYIRDHVGSLVRPVRELRGFQKVSLKPGESRELTFTLTPDDLAFIHADMTRSVEPGEFSVWVAPNAAAGTPVKFTVK